MVHAFDKLEAKIFRAEAGEFLNGFANAKKCAEPAGGLATHEGNRGTQQTSLESDFLQCPAKNRTGAVPAIFKYGPWQIRGGGCFGS